MPMHVELFSSSGVFYHRGCAMISNKPAGYKGKSGYIVVKVAADRTSTYSILFEPEFLQY